MPADSTLHPGLKAYLCTSCAVPTPEPTKRCEVCGRTLNLALYPTDSTQDPEYLCPKHSQERALHKGAREHLMGLLDHVMRDWVLHWGQTVTSVEDIADVIDWCILNHNGVEYQERQAYVRSILGRT